MRLAARLALAAVAVLRACGQRAADALGCVGGMLRSMLRLRLCSRCWRAGLALSAGSAAGCAERSIVGALSVGQRERVVVVEVGEHLAGAGRGAGPGQRALHTLPDARSRMAALAGRSRSTAAATLPTWFKQTIEKRDGNG